jgi:hypothetical protein
LFLFSLGRALRDPILEFWMIHGVERSIKVRPATNFDCEWSSNGIIHRQDLGNVPNSDRRIRKQRGEEIGVLQSIIVSDGNITKGWLTGCVST